MVVGQDALALLWLAIMATTSAVNLNRFRFRCRDGVGIHRRYIPYTALVTCWHGECPHVVCGGGHSGLAIDLLDKP